MPRILLTACYSFASLVALASCGSTPEASPIPVAASGYTNAFDAVREELRWMGFELERIDARAGVIETRPKPTAGLATPWDIEQSTPGQEWDDFVNDHRRIVRVTFTPTGADSAEAVEVPSDTDTELGVEVTIYRLRAPGSRIETESVSLNSMAVDVLAADRGLAGRYLTPIGRDPRLEARLSERLRARLAKTSS